MLPRSSPPATEVHPVKKPKPSLSSPSGHHFSAWVFAAVIALQLLLILSARSIDSRGRLTIAPSHSPAVDTAHACPSGLAYVYSLPAVFNHDVLQSHATLSNGGLGRTVPGASLAGLVPPALHSAWHATDQFAAELIYHRRILAHPCRTLNSSAAAAFYVPFYAGLAVGRIFFSPNATSSDRDHICAALLRWLAAQAPYIHSGGQDHFMVLGRITWDFRRSRDGEWGSSFLHMKGMENVTRLLIERNPWDDRDVGVPYPTGFHPHSAAELLEWQRFVLSRSRPTLFSFAGAARPGFKDDFRALLLEECKRSADACQAVDCSGGRCGNGSTETLGLFLGSKFCLQPRGDSFTRRSMFDCMVAGGIPVLFWRRSAYTQYGWYLPNNQDEDKEWSVYIDRREVRSGGVSVKEVLEGIDEERVRRMRERVVEMMPRLVYAGVEAGLGDGVKDAFDVALDGVLRRFQGRRRRRRRRASGQPLENVPL